MRRFESCPHSQDAGVAFWLRAPVLQTGAVEFDPLPRYQDFARIAFCSLNPAVRYGSDKAGQVGSTPAASTRMKCACGRADLCIPFLPGTTGVRILPGAPARGRSMAGRWILVPTTSVRFTPSRPSLVLVRRHSTAGWPPYKGSTWVRLPAPQPCVLRVRSS